MHIFVAYSLRLSKLFSAPDFIIQNFIKVFLLTGQFQRRRYYEKNISGFFGSGNGFAYAPGRQHEGVGT